LPDPAHEHRVDPGALQRRRRTVTVADQHDPRRRREQLDGLGLGERPAELQVGGHGVADEDGYPDAGGGHGDRVVVEDLAGLPDELPLLGRVAPLLHRPGQRDDVPGDRFAPHLTGREGLVRPRPAVPLPFPGALRPLLLELPHPGLPGAGHRLVGRDDHPPEPGGPVERRQRRHQHHRRAVGAGGDALRQMAELFGVDFRHHQRHVGVHPEGGRVVDHPGARRRRHRRPLDGQRVVDVDDDQAEPVETAGAEDLAGDLGTGERQPSPLRPGRGVGPQLGHRERPLLQDPQHLAADEAGGADDADADGRATHETSTPPVEPSASPKASCNARTARSTLSARTTQEIRMELVEIISMFTPSRARISNMVAATPGWVFMPAPISDTRAMPLSSSNPVAPRSPTSPSMTFPAFFRSSFGSVNEMSVMPLLLTFCTIMSTFTVSSASARKTRAAMPTWSGTPVIVTFASEVSCVTPEMIAASIVSSSSLTQVPGSQVKLDRTCTATLWFRANSTERRASTRPPVAAMSSISS